MATQLLLISDTHVPKRARDLPDSVWRAIDAVDVVFHAGDWVSADLLDQIEQRTPRLIGVYGNNDGEDLRARLPEIARAEVDGIRFAMIHETGHATGREERADQLFPDVAVLVFGHSHIPWDSTSPGLRLLNPGSPTDRRRQPACTFMTAVVENGVLRDITLHEV
jgi:uncharacterized protein